jgi:UDP-N-acetylmuramoyl-L-alanyl-D-glutamate--2,6-diaminopimelate ligase
LCEIGDRRAAIAAVVAEAQPGDAVVVAGKGHETGQEIRGVQHPFDDAHGRRLLDEARIPMRTFSPGGADGADWAAVDRSYDVEGTAFTVGAPRGRRFPPRGPLPGEFNVAKAVCAIALAGEAGFDPESVAEGIAGSTGVPGRMERIDAGQEFLAVVDYAHKPDALDAVLRALRPQTEGRLIVVVGAGGDRDTGKRPVMGRIAAELADVVVVTDDNPRTEDPAAIRAAVLGGAREHVAEVLEIGDRRAAIRHAIALAGAGDTGLAAGKGHETGQETGAGADRVVHPFDDRDEVRAALGARR